MNLIKKFFALFSSKKEEVVSTTVEETITEVLNTGCSKGCNRPCRNNCDCTEDFVEEDMPLTTKLNLEKDEAIKACDGCENEVLVLRLAGEDIGYYKSINQLCNKNRFKKKTSVYRYWNNKQNLNKGDQAGLLFGKYEIVKLS